MSDFKHYLVSYRHEGAQWNVEIPARSVEDAHARLGQFHFAKVEGEIVSRIPSALGPIAALATTIQNAFRRSTKGAGY